MEIPTSERPKLHETLDESGRVPTVSVEEVLDRIKELEAWYDKRIVFSQVRGICTLLFAYPYKINLDRITTAEHLFDWTLHLLDKPWLESGDVKTIIKRIAEFKKIRIYD